MALENASLYETVQAERRTLDAIVQQMPAGLALVEAPSGRLVFSNQELERILGHPPPALASHEQYARGGAVHPDLTPYRPEEYPIARARLTGKTLEDEEMLYQRGDGRLAHLSVTAATPLQAFRPHEERGGRWQEGLGYRADPREGSGRSAWVERSPEKGTTFRVRIPRNARPPQQA